MVTSNGVPVGELTPLRADRYVRAEAMLAIFAPAPPVDLERLRADLDATASQDLEPRA
jgi:antitoxin (DNA-binding transcriptional repressor) of toxin-antitoxin stability system